MPQLELKVDNENGSLLQSEIPLRVGCVLSGGQAAGGHNVVMGLFDMIRKLNPESKLFGFLNGPKGIFTNDYMEITPEYMGLFRNTGGFDMIRSGRDKIEKPDQFENSLKYCAELNLDGLVVIGGDDSNTNACLLAEYFAKNDAKTKVIGCPKTIDGDLQNEHIPVSFGFDTATKVYSEAIGNLCSDVISSKEYYHFVRLMGRSASHIALECALRTQINCVLIGEEVEQQKQTLQQVTN
jgi:diphosphate--fructose-6-phosphate 1-phosphotransferase